jgi:general secretion pathway protein F
MPQFQYRAVTASGELVEGMMTAVTKSAVVAQLQMAGHVPLRAVELGAGVGAAVRAAGGRRGRRISAQALALLIRELATLLHAGMPIDRAIEILVDLVENDPERNCLRRLRASIENGTGLADAMAQQGGVFPEFCVSMARAGEAAANLDLALERTAEFLEQSYATREEIKSALTYPLMVLGTCFVSLLLLFGVVVPRFRSIFEQGNSQMPLLTQAVLAISGFLENYWWALLIGGGLCIAFVYAQISSVHARRRWAGRLLSLPVIGDIFRKTETARFCRTLGTLLKSDVPLLAALQIARATVQTPAMVDALSSVIESARAGKGLAEPLLRAEAFPRLAVHFIKVGEETAKHDEMLLRVADIFECDTKRSIQRLLTMLGPSLTIAMAVIVLIVIGAILGAVFSVYDLATA